MSQQYYEEIEQKERERIESDPVYQQEYGEYLKANGYDGWWLFLDENQEEK